MAPRYPSGSTAPARKNAKLKRHMREKSRREKLLRAKPPGAKEKFISGCFAAGILGVLTVISVLIYACVTYDW